jgi:hypothetical protein
MTTAPTHALFVDSSPTTVLAGRVPVAPYLVPAAKRTSRRVAEPLSNTDPAVPYSEPLLNGAKARPQRYSPPLNRPPNPHRSAAPSHGGFRTPAEVRSLHQRPRQGRHPKPYAGAVVPMTAWRIVKSIGTANSSGP